MKTIIRIEHPDSGYGIWRHEKIKGSCVALAWQLSFYHELSNKHREFPAPYEDLGINRVAQANEYCAFKSLEQIYQWIEKEWFNEIISFGFKVYMIDISEHVEGEYQILFKKEHILQQEDISSLFI